MAVHVMASLTGWLWLNFVTGPSASRTIDPTPAPTGTRAHTKALSANLFDRDRLPAYRCAQNRMACARQPARQPVTRAARNRYGACFDRGRDGASITDRGVPRIRRAARIGCSTSPSSASTPGNPVGLAWLPELGGQAALMSTLVSHGSDILGPCHGSISHACHRSSTRT